MLPFYEYIGIYSLVLVDMLSLVLVYPFQYHIIHSCKCDVHHKCALCSYMETIRAQPRFTYTSNYTHHTAAAATTTLTVDVVDLPKIYYSTSF